MTDSTYTRTVRIPVKRLTAKKAGMLARAMKDYRRAREQTIQYFHQKTDPLEFSYSEREDFRKQLSKHDRINLPARTLYPAITTVEQNYAEYEKGQFDSPPTAERVDTLGLEGQNTRIFHTNGGYYLDVATGHGNVALPLRTTDADWHARRLPTPDAVPPTGRSRTGVAFADLEPGDFPADTVKLSTSTLTRTGERQYIANLVFKHEKRVTQRVETPRFIVGVDRGRNQLAYAAVYDRDRDHVHNWWNRSGDEVEHYMNEYAQRIREFQAAGVWEQMEQSRKRRYRYKRQVDFEVANAIVALARERFNVAIAVEDLSSMGRLGGYAAESRRFTEWSYARLRDAIERKAEPYDIPVVDIQPQRTSQVCSRCESDDTARSGVHFTCRACGYEQHADANAAVNIAKRAVNTDVEPVDGQEVSA